MQLVHADITIMSLCFGEAFDAKRAGKITEEEYFGHLLAHFRGVRHPQDSGIEREVSSFDPVGASIRELALRTDYQPMQGNYISSLTRRMC